MKPKLEPEEGIEWPLIGESGELAALMDMVSNHEVSSCFYLELDAMHDILLLLLYRSTSNMMFKNFRLSSMRRDISILESLASNDSSCPSTMNR